MADFDSSAQEYDKDFTHTPIGKLQREVVWRYLEKTLPKRPLNILELNAGTGEDAIWLARRGHRVVCTDASSEMIQIAEKKAKKEEVQHLISFSKLDFKRPEEFVAKFQFDLVFSNFGGINCIDETEMQNLSSFCSNWLLPDGEMIWVMLGKYCLWEWFYFFFKGQFGKSERRWTKEGVDVPVNDKKVKTWYYSPGELRNALELNYRRIGSRAVGMFVPPSYLNPFFKNRQGILNTLGDFDRSFGSDPFFESLSDHYLMHFKKR